MINISSAAEMDHHLGSEFRQIDGLTQRALHKPHPIFHFHSIWTSGNVCIGVCNPSTYFVPDAMKNTFQGGLVVDLAGHTWARGLEWVWFWILMPQKFGVPS